MQPIKLRPDKKEIHDGKFQWFYFGIFSFKNLNDTILWCKKQINSELDEMLSSLGVAPVSEVLSSLSSVNSLTSDVSANATPEGSLQPNSNGTR